MQRRTGLLKQGSQRVTTLDGAKVYATLKEQIIKDRVLERSYSYYSIISAVIFTGFLVSVYLVAVTPVSFTLFGFIMLLTFFSIQIAGLLHDAGHRAVFNSTKNNDIFGNICGFFIALGFNAWRIKHNKHHARTNQEGGDPDVEMPLLSFSKERFSSKKGITKFLVRHQAYLYFPLGVLVIFSPRIGTMRYLVKNLTLRTWWEAVVFVAPFFAWYILPFLAFDLQKALFFFFFANLSAGLYLLNVFAPNHKGMPLIDQGVKFSFLEQQIITSRNIRGNWFVDFVYMGLNYQIEHHLFPNTPRNKLGKITPYVLDICHKMNLEYTSVSVFEQNKIILSELHRMGREETS